MQDNSYASSFSSKHKQNMEIFRKIENKMTESGYRYKNYLQIGVRWKNLKNLYMKARRSNSKNEQQLFPFYDEMDSLMGGLLKQASSEEYASELDETDTITREQHTPVKKLCNANDPTPKRTEEEPVPVKRKRGTSVTTMAEASPSRKAAELSPTVSVHTKVDRNGKLSATLAMSKQELSDEFYRSQKRLIDYEFSLYVRKEEELIDRMQESTRAILEEGMDKFFTRLKEVLGGHQTVQHEEVIETYE
uniref:Myb/SANT-like DNA-binding domain-containing protein n=2 Tax=Anopheles stephensi TaxID=30069 RepID=A0A182Y2D3_ANOST